LFEKDLCVRICVLCVLCGWSFAACGQKGPPLAPIVYLPAPVGEFTAKRVGSDVVLQFKIPTTNSDSTNPADLERVEVYAHTGPLPSPADFVRYGTLIKTIPVKPSGAATPSPVADRPQISSGEVDLVEQGAAVSVAETMTEAHKTLGPLPFNAQTPAAPIVEQVETPGTVNLPMPIVRYYTAVGVSRSRNRRGAFAGPIGVPLIDPPAAPDGVNVSYTADALSLKWAPTEGDSEVPVVDVSATPVEAGPPPAVGAETAVDTSPHQELETPGTIETAAVDVAGGASPAPEIKPVPTSVSPGVPAIVPRPRFGYNVYDASMKGPPVVPLNSALLTAPAFSDPRVEFGTERCYVVRRVEVAGTVAIESEAAGPHCVTPIDTFPPAAPRELRSVTTDGAVNLVWEPNTEKDLAGYVVLRRDAPGEKLARLTRSPIQDTMYRDASVQSGRTYEYEVLAVDNATPPNESGPSNRVMEVIR
jgi:hypothetical protein